MSSYVRVVSQEITCKNEAEMFLGQNEELNAKFSFLLISWDCLKSQGMASDHPQLG